MSTINNSLNRENNSVNAVQQAALELVRARISVIPVNREDKTPRAELLPGGTWAQYQVEIATEQQVRAWFQNGANVAVVTGMVSGGLVSIDFDEARFYDAWRESVGDLSDGLPVDLSKRGPRVFFRCPNPGRNEKLAHVPDDMEFSGRRAAIETRGEGGYIVVAPSIHASGHQYKVIFGSLTDIPTISQARADALLGAARRLDECPLTRQQREQEQHAPRRSHPYEGESVIASFNGAHTIEEMLEAHGYTRKGNRYVRPGGERTSITIRDNESYHHHSADPLSDGYWKDPFAVFCLLDHGGDVRAAVKTAAAELGLQKPPTPSGSNGPAGDAKITASDQPADPGLDAAIAEINALPVGERDPAIVALITEHAGDAEATRVLLQRRLERELKFCRSDFNKIVKAAAQNGKDENAPAVATTILWDEEPKMFQQSMDFVDGVPVTVVGLYGTTGEGEPVYLPYLVTGKRELLPQEAGMRKYGLALAADEGPFLDGRWSKSGIRKFVHENYDPNPGQVFSDLERVIDYFVEFQACRVAEKNGEPLPADASRYLVVLDIMKTYFRPVLPAMGYTLLTGEKGSGKTTAQRLQVKLSFLGVHITGAGTMAALKRMADNGQTLCFDDIENLADKTFDVDKRAIILAGNTRAVTVPLVEEDQHGRKHIRHFRAYCSKSFTNISGVDDVLGSRVYRVGMVRATDKSRTRRDPDATLPPVPYQKIVDNLYTLAMLHMAEVEQIYHNVDTGDLADRDLQVWRPILALARWIELHDATGRWANLRETMINLAKAKQDEQRVEGTEGFDVVLIRALVKLFLDEGEGRDEQHALTAERILDVMEDLSPDSVTPDEKHHVASDGTVETVRVWPRGLTTKVGKKLRSLQLLKVNENPVRVGSHRGYILDRLEVERRATAYGIPFKPDLPLDENEF